MELTIDELSKYLRVPRSVLYDYLLKQEYVYKNSNNLIIAYKKYIEGEDAYFKNVNKVVHGYPRYFTVVTDRGIKEFEKVFKNYNSDVKTF